MYATREQVIVVTKFVLGNPAKDCLSRLLHQFKLYGATGLLLDDHCTFFDPTGLRQVGDQQGDQVAAPRLAVNRQVEECEIAFLPADLQSNPNGPGFPGASEVVSSRITGPWSQCEKMLSRSVVSQT
jgi:hypothetical protein